jgi:hypothetical protein
VSICITAGCLAHHREVFIRLDKGAPYPWVHGDLSPCDGIPPATAAEAHEVCACEHDTAVHKAPAGPIPNGQLAHYRACRDCDCPDFTHTWMRPAPAAAVPLVRAA